MIVDSVTYAIGSRYVINQSQAVSQERMMAYLYADFNYTKDLNLMFGNQLCEGNKYPCLSFAG